MKRDGDSFGKAGMHQLFPIPEAYSPYEYWMDIREPEDQRVQRKPTVNRNYAKN